MSVHAPIGRPLTNAQSLALAAGVVAFAAFCAYCAVLVWHAVRVLLGGVWS